MNHTITQVKRLVGDSKDGLRRMQNRSARDVFDNLRLLCRVTFGINGIHSGFDLFDVVFGQSQSIQRHLLELFHAQRFQPFLQISQTM
jgi:hypothetical protein